MVYDELLQTDAVSVISKIKSTVWSLNALLQTEQNLLDPGPLLEKKVFPVKDADGTRRLAFATTDFAIGDREYLIAQFADKIKILDYTVEEVRRLRPFFQWANLTPPFLSNAVQGSATVSGGMRPSIAIPKRDLKRKAYALLRWGCQ